MNKKRKRIVVFFFAFFVGAIVVGVFSYINSCPRYATKGKVNFIVVGGASERFHPEFDRIISSTINQDFYSYFQWFHYKEICKYIDDHDGDVVIIGHSYGGSTAYRVAEKYCERVLWLITLDPVSLSPPVVNVQGLNWVNVITKPIKYSLNDFVASIGGKWNEIQGARNIPISCAHNEIDVMLLAEPFPEKNSWDLALEELDDNAKIPYPNVFSKDVSDLENRFLSIPNFANRHLIYFASMGRKSFQYYFPAYYSYFKSDLSRHDYDTLNCVIELLENINKNNSNWLREMSPEIVVFLSYCKKNINKFSDGKSSKMMKLQDRITMLILAINASV